MTIIVNFLLFQIAWFACVLGAGRGNLWIGPLAVLLVVAVHLVISDNPRREALIIGAASLIGLLVDTALTAAGVYTPARQYMPVPLSPLWLISMWPNFATLFNVSLRWLHGRYFLAVILGASGGGLAYYGGMQLGALTFPVPVLQNVLFVGIAWAFVTPLLFWIVGLANEKIQRSG